MYGHLPYGQTSNLGSQTNMLSGHSHHPPAAVQNPYLSQYPFAGYGVYGQPGTALAGSQPHAFGPAGPVLKPVKQPRLVPILPWSPHDLIIEEIEIDDEGKEIGRKMSMLTAPSSKKQKHLERGAIDETTWAMYKEEVTKLLMDRDLDYNEKKRREEAKTKKLQEELVALQVEEDLRRLKELRTARQSNASTVQGHVSRNSLSKLGKTGELSLVTVTGESQFNERTNKTSVHQTDKNSAKGSIKSKESKASYLSDIPEEKDDKESVPNNPSKHTINTKDAGSRRTNPSLQGSAKGKLEPQAGDRQSRTSKADLANNDGDKATTSSKSKVPGSTLKPPL